jgi:hypothetical protein
MKSFIGVTDNDWFAFLSQQPGIDGVNFGSLGGQALHREFSLMNPPFGDFPSSIASFTRDEYTNTENDIYGAFVKSAYGPPGAVLFRIAKNKVE